MLTESLENPPLMIEKVQYVEIRFVFPSSRSFSAPQRVESAANEETGGCITGSDGHEVEKKYIKKKKKKMSHGDVVSCEAERTRWRRNGGLEVDGAEAAAQRTAKDKADADMHQSQRGRASHLKALELLIYARRHRTHGTQDSCDASCDGDDMRRESTMHVTILEHCHPAPFYILCVFIVTL